VGESFPQLSNAGIIQACLAATAGMYADAAVYAIFGYCITAVVLVCW